MAADRLWTDKDVELVADALAAHVAGQVPGMRAETLARVRPAHEGMARAVLEVLADLGWRKPTLDVSSNVTIFMDALPRRLRGPKRW